jgi:hypothetical protein
MAYTQLFIKLIIDWPGVQIPPGPLLFSPFSFILLYSTRLKKILFCNYLFILLRLARQDSMACNYVIILNG